MPWKYRKIAEVLLLNAVIAVGASLDQLLEILPGVEWNSIKIHKILHPTVYFTSQALGACSRSCQQGLPNDQTIPASRTACTSKQDLPAGVTE
jgi:hypothetical protein